jgi:hypothetical protein
MLGKLDVTQSIRPFVRGLSMDEAIGFGSVDCNVSTPSFTAMRETFLQS